MDEKETNEKEGDAFQAGKEKLKAGSEVVKKQISLLPFKNLVEEKVPAATRDKYPVLNKLIPLANFIFVGLAIVILIFIIAIAGSGSNPKALAKQTYEISLQALSSYSNPSKAASLARKYEALEKKVEKLSDRNKAIYYQEIVRLSGLSGLLDFDF